MAKLSDKLTDRFLGNLTLAKADKDHGGKHKFADGRGLFAELLPTGQISFRMKFRLPGNGKLKEGRLTFGLYPDTSLKEARRRRQEALDLLKDHRDPRLAQAITATAQPSGRTLEAVARDWHSNTEANRTSSDYHSDILRRLERSVFPFLGHRDITSITRDDVVGVLRKLEQAGTVSTAHRVRAELCQIFDEVGPDGMRLMEYNPARMKKGFKRHKERKQPALTTLPELRELLAASEQIDCQPIFKLALRFLALTAARPGMVLKATWDQFGNWEQSNAPEWRVPGEQMKNGEEWVSPLSGAALDILRAMKRLRVGRFVFPDWHAAGQDKPLADHCLNRLLTRLGYVHNAEARKAAEAQGLKLKEHTAHGFRSSFSTIMNNVRPGDEMCIEAQLAHTIPGVKGRYNRGDYLSHRAEIVANWTSLLLPAGSPTADDLLHSRVASITNFATAA